MCRRRWEATHTHVCIIMFLIHTSYIYLTCMTHNKQIKTVPSHMIFECYTRHTQKTGYTMEKVKKRLWSRALNPFILVRFDFAPFIVFSLLLLLVLVCVFVYFFQFCFHESFFVLTAHSIVLSSSSSFIIHNHILRCTVLGAVCQKSNSPWFLLSTSWSSPTSSDFVFCCC